jgi:uncharacterized membrane protein YgaE (UPF0421/DUF939 family)
MGASGVTPVAPLDSWDVTIARLSPRWSARRLRPRLLPIAQTAAAAVIAYYVAQLLPLHEQRPVFASIAAVISLGATYTRRGPRTFELIGGVVLGLTVADLIIQAVGTGPLQIGLMIVLAMGTAVVLGGGELLVTEAAVSALLLAALGPADHGLSADRFLEALSGGAVALAVGFLFFPPDPALLVSRAAHSLFGELGATLEQVSRALADADPGRAQAALRGAREMDAGVDALEEALATAGQTARFAPLRRRTRALLDRYRRTFRQLDFAVRNARVLARHSMRYSRARLAAPDGLPEALHELAEAVWMLAAAYDEPQRAAEASELARAAAARARAVFEREPDLELTAILSQVRSLAADLMRAAKLLEGSAEASYDQPSEELLDAVPAAA